jgi:hypothetical protein
MAAAAIIRIIFMGRKRIGRGALALLKLASHRGR